jgi:hypothetical protein
MGHFPFRQRMILTTSFFLLTTVQSVGECQMVGGEQFQHLHYILHIVNLRCLFEVN